MLPEGAATLPPFSTPSKPSRGGIISRGDVARSDEMGHEWRYPPRSSYQMRRLETFDWWPELISLKDTLSLRELAQKFDVTPGAISAALRREGINREPAPPGPRNARKRTDEEALPPEPGESPKPRPTKEGKAEPRSHSKDARLLSLWDDLGKLPDRDIADKAGISVRTVASFRARHGIAAYAGPRKARAAGAGGNGAVGHGNQAWTVVLRSSKGDATRVVIADTLVDAAGVASERAAGARIVSVSWVGELL